MIGRTIGSYRIVEQIGMGGMATVYKAYDPNTDRYVAIKILPQHFSQDPTFRQRFAREAKAIAKLEHLHILPIFAYGEEDGIAYMVMRYLPSGTLTDRIRQGPLPLAEAARLLSQIADALDYAHARGVLHRDIKPSNILLDASGNAFLTDFGIAKMVEATVELTGAGVLGTPAYMSPEQCRGSRDLTPASDQYSLGIVLYEMVTGSAPFQAETPIALIYKHLNDPLPLPHTLRPDLPEAAEQVILKALAKEPEQRYKTCRQMAAAFAQAVTAAETQPQISPPATRTPPPARKTVHAAEEATRLHQPVPSPPKRRRLFWLAGAAVLVAVLLGAGILALSLLSGETANQTAEGPAPGESTETALPALQAGSLVDLPEPPPTSRTAYPCPGEPGICIAPIWSSTPRQILTDAGLNLEEAGQLGWSPDGQQIVLAARRSDQPNRLYLVNADGSGLHPLPLVENDVTPTWSPNGEWLAFHSGGNLSIMRPDGRDPAVLLHTDEVGCAVNPQWSPDSQRLVVSVLVDGCDWQWPFSGRREVWVVSPPDGPAEPLLSFEHNNPDCADFQVAFSPDGRAIAAVDADCQPRLYRASDGSEIGPLDEFPEWWTNQIYPQWGRYRHPRPYEFAEDFSNPPLNLERWEPQEGALDETRVFIEDGRLWVDMQNEEGEPWQMNLPARLEYPVNAVEFVIGLEEMEGDEAGLGVNLTVRDGQSVDLLLDSQARLVADTAGQQVVLTQPALPVEHPVLLKWEAGKMVIMVSGRPVGELPVEGPATWVSFWASAGPGERLTGYFDDIRLTLKPAVEAESPASGGKVAEVCEGSDPPQLCVVNLPNGERVQITRDLNFEAIFGLSWSPDGRQIAFDAGGKNQPDHRLYIINADGTGLHRLTGDDFNDITPAWSPDGEWIAVHRNCGLALLRPDGGEPQVLQEETEDSCVSGPSWSPDGEWIAFVKAVGAEDFLNLIRVDGAEEAELHAFADAVEYGMTGWSPDGQEIAVWYETSGGKQQGVILRTEDGAVIERMDSPDQLPWDWFPNVWRP